MIGRKVGMDIFIFYMDKCVYILCVYVEFDVLLVNGFLRYKCVFCVLMLYGYVDYLSCEEGLMYMYLCNIMEVFKMILKNVVGNDKYFKFGDVIVDSLISVV